MQYSIITPVKNEGKYIASTIQSVLEQSVVPDKWIIIDDHSTDQTKEIISEYMSNNNFIELIFAPEINIQEISARI